MALKTVVDAVEARLAAEWTRCPVVEMNTTGETDDGASPFLVVQFPVTATTRPPVNDRLYHVEGAFRLVLHKERGVGMGEALEWAEELADLFRSQRFGGVVTQAPSEPFIDDSNDRGNYFVVAIVCPYTHDFLG